ncbi:GlxA family transcriptional regulator [Pseudomarimonas salicorniae]|uniref:GlxA family transcriptional regulator n=1 Tax=Pseudomarimonas salicorniae TaxID=2933270 RepID=A0ABT0GCB3_9GAMM|nr:GlxA family transcriptional regulator [Lysobacter sp. CAU 1642]MCK7592179.1 GlxA family transcriptional regulator [Lysobacter sp. CAU 1642]
MEVSVHRVVCLAFDDAQVLDITGPLEVFGRAARVLRDTGAKRGLCYEVAIASRGAAPVRTSSGLSLVAVGDWNWARSADTLLVAGGIGWEAASRDSDLLALLQQAHRAGTRLASICTGALVLARAGLLDERPATTHWAHFDSLRRVARGARIDRDALFVRSAQNLYTSAGVTAGIDLALSLVEQDHGLATALEVARQLVVFVKRPGNQAQISRTLATQAVSDQRLRQVVQWLSDHLDQDLSVPVLAERAAMSPRNFTRRFTEELGLPPSRLVEQLRCEAVARRLAETDLPLARIAQQLGFASVETLRRTFQRHYGMSPAEYRQRATHDRPTAAGRADVPES